MSGNGVNQDLSRLTSFRIYLLRVSSEHMGAFHREIITFGLGLCVLLSVSQKVCLAQGVRSSENLESGVVLSKLVPPIYPPVARAAHVTGDVDLLLTIRQDGSVDDVVMTNGSPLLKESAVTSVQQSRFECRGCTEQLTKYRLVYTFEIEGECECEPKETQSNKNEPAQAFPRVSDAPHRVTVVAQILCICDPPPFTTKVRSLRCLYLWRCKSKF